MQDDEHRRLDRLESWLEKISHDTKKQAELIERLVAVEEKHVHTREKIDLIQQANIEKFKLIDERISKVEVAERKTDKLLEKMSTRATVAGSFIGIIVAALSLLIPRILGNWLGL